MTMAPIHPKRWGLRDRRLLTVAAELAALLVWTLFVFRAYVNFDPGVTPTGREYFTAMQSNFMWDRARECGLCALWNGSVEGGYPAVIDVHDAMLHPVVIVPSLIWGTLNGAKLALVGTFLMAGIAQWWLARALGLGKVARLWSGGMAIAAGNLAGKMEDGAFAVGVSTAACALILPALVQLSIDGRRRSAALLGVAGGLAIVAGQGYLQIAVGLISPVFLILFIGGRMDVRRVVRRLGLAGGIAGCIAAPFLVPLLHFYPSFTKDLDPTFGSAQPFRYVPLNLVIKDPAFYQSDALGKMPFPYLYINYIGWVAVVLAVFGFIRLARARPRIAWFLLAWAVSTFWIASADPLRMLRDVAKPLPSVWSFVVGIRNPPLIARLAISAILGLAAVGVDEVVRSRKRWPQCLIGVASPVSGRVFRVGFDTGLVAAALLLFALNDVKDHARIWISTAPTPAEMAPVLDRLRTPDAQWVNTPFGEQAWLGRAISRNLKISAAGIVWHWKDRPEPEPVLEASWVGPPPGMDLASKPNDISIYRAPPGREYAAVEHDDGSRSVCTAQSRGGDIDVACDTTLPGTLVVQENFSPDWTAEINGASKPVRQEGRAMTMAVPAGHATIALRYRPWDVPVGLALMTLGVAVAAYALIRREETALTGLEPGRVRVDASPDDAAG